MHASAHGRHQKAFDLYEALLDALDPDSPDATAHKHLLGSCLEPSPVEEGLWHKERLNCLQLLGQWGTVEGQIEEELKPAAAADEDDDQPPQLSLLFNSSSSETKALLRPYARACLFEGDRSRSKLGGLLEVAEGDKGWMSQLLEVAGVEVTAYEMMQGHLERARAAIQVALRWGGGGQLVGGRCHSEGRL